MGQNGQRIRCIMLPDKNSSHVSDINGVQGDHVAVSTAKEQEVSGAAIQTDSGIC